MLSTRADHPGAYVSVMDGIRRIYRTDGLVGFYRGLVPSLFGVSHGAVQFMVYEKFKDSRKALLHPGVKQLSNLDYLLFSGLSKVLAGTVTYPYQVVRSRLQMHDAEKIYTGPVDVMRKVWAREGMMGLYKGLGPNLLRTVPSTCVTFLVYENTKSWLSRAA